MNEYRRGALRCPGCDDVMTHREVKDAHVDLCPTCQGLWIDWLDGDITTVATAVGSLPRAAAAETGSNACPVCAAALDRATLDDDAAVVWRCGTCAGAFVPRSSFEAITAPLPEADPEAGEDPFLTRVLDRLGRLLLG